jgi:putative hemolysin
MIQLEFPLVLALVVVGWLTAGGTAVRSVSRIWLRHWAERRLRGAAAALTYLDRPQRLLVAASAGVGITLSLAGVRLGIASSGPVLALRLLVYGGMMVLVGQMIPRAIARRWAPSLTPIVLPILRAAEILATPFVSLGRLATRPFEKRRELTDKERDREAIQDLLREGELEGVGQHDEIAIISGVVEFGEKKVREVMTPRADIFALEDTVDPHILAVHIAQSAYSRVPVYHGSIDNIVGMVHAFDVLKAGGEGMPPLRPVAVTTNDTPANELLFRMLRERLHLAIVRDEAQHTAGLVSLEDLLEELVGDIRDEHDEPEPPRADDSSGAR